MILKNLAAAGIERQVKPLADLEIIKKHQPIAIAKLILLLDLLGEKTSGLFIPLVIPEIVLSGYRDKSVDAQVKNSPHFFGVAFDLYAPTIERQIEIAKLATIETKLFERAGLYPQNKIVHIDLCDAEWQTQYHGTKYWVKKDTRYTGFLKLDYAIEFAKK